MTVRLEAVPDSDDLMLPIPADVLEQLGWKEGDKLSWEIREDGNVTFTKTVSDLKRGGPGA